MCSFAGNRVLNSQLIKTLVFIILPWEMKKGYLRSGVIQWFYNVNSIPESFYLSASPPTACVSFFTVALCLYEMKLQPIMFSLQVEEHRMGTDKKNLLVE